MLVMYTVVQWFFPPTSMSAGWSGAAVLWGVSLSGPLPTLWPACSDCCRRNLQADSHHVCTGPLHPPAPGPNCTAASSQVMRRKVPCNPSGSYCGLQAKITYHQYVWKNNKKYMVRNSKASMIKPKLILT